MKIFVTGASGLIGSNILSYFNNRDCEIVGSHFSCPTDKTFFFNTTSLNDVKNFNLIKYKPDFIIHCGAMTNVDAAEENFEESFLHTVISTNNLLEIANLTKAKFIYISTDYVFDGKVGFYKETDLTNPINTYGKHKLEAEELVKKTIDNFIILRITNVYGKEYRNKNFIARLIKQMAEKQDINLSLPIDQFATPINAFDVAKAIWQLMNNNSNGLYHLASTDYLNRCQLAEKVFRYFEYKNYNINRLVTQTLHQKAQRPLLGGMSASKFITENPDFQFSCIEDYLKQIKDGI